MSLQNKTTKSNIFANMSQPYVLQGICICHATRNAKQVQCAILDAYISFKLPGLASPFLYKRTRRVSACVKYFLLIFRVMLHLIHEMRSITSTSGHRRKRQTISLLLQMQVMLQLICYSQVYGSTLVRNI